MYPKSDVALANLVAQLEANTNHYVLSEMDRPMICPEQIQWVTIETQDMDLLTEKVMALLENESPVRVTLPVLQHFLGVVRIGELISGVENIIDAVRGSCHVVSIPTALYIPQSFPIWGEVEKFNAFVFKKSVEMALPILLLHKSFLTRQKNKWVVSPDCFLEFVTDNGLGQSLTVNAKYRYASRILRFHASLRHAEPPCQVSSPVVPLPLAETWRYAEKPETAEILQGLGYEVKPRPANKRGGRKPKGEKSKGEVSTGGKSGVVSYLAPKPISVISIDEGTFKRTFRENMELRKDLKLLQSGLDDTERYVTKLLGEVKDLKGDLKTAKAERDRYREESRRTSRKYRKLDEDSYSDMMDWRNEREALEKEVFDLKWEQEETMKDLEEAKKNLQREKERYTVLEIQLGVWERWVEAEKKKDEKKRRKE